MCRNPLGIKQKCRPRRWKITAGVGGLGLCLSNKGPDFSGPFEYIPNSKAVVLNLLGLKLALSKRAFMLFTGNALVAHMANNLPAMREARV